VLKPPRRAAIWPPFKPSPRAATAWSRRPITAGIGAIIGITGGIIVITAGEHAGYAGGA